METLECHRLFSYTYRHDLCSPAFTWLWEFGILDLKIVVRGSLFIAFVVAGPVVSHSLVASIIIAVTWALGENVDGFFMLFCARGPRPLWFFAIVEYRMEIGLGGAERTELVQYLRFTSTSLALSLSLSLSLAPSRDQRMAYPRETQFYFIAKPSLLRQRRYEYAS